MSVSFKVANDSQNSSIYETPSMVNDYLYFHYCTVPHGISISLPEEYYNFPKRCSDLCLELCKEYEISTKRALDIGCSVGRTSFELARCFTSVLGIDLSDAFIQAAEAIKQRGWLDLEVLVEGNLTKHLRFEISEDIDRSRCTFRQGDACTLPQDEATGLSDGVFDLIFAGNLICRLPDPCSFLNRASQLIRPGGLLVLTSPYTWLENFTPQDKWLCDATNNQRGIDGLKMALEGKFEFVSQKEMPFVIRETERQHQVTLAQATAWKKL